MLFRELNNLVKIGGVIWCRGKVWHGEDSGSVMRGLGRLAYFFIGILKMHWN